MFNMLMKDPQYGPQLLSNLYFKRLLDLEKIRDGDLP
jgi:hypothetical protein